MAVCPDGHPSASDDFCDVCGLRIGPMSAAQPAADAWGSPSRAPRAGGAPAAAGPGPGARPGNGANCPNCGTGRTGRFCEGCGLDYSSGLLPGGMAPSGSQVPGRSPTMLSQPAPPPAPSPSWAPPRNGDNSAPYRQPPGYDQPPDYGPPPGYGPSQDYGQPPDYGRSQAYGQSQGYGQPPYEAPVPSAGQSAGSRPAADVGPWAVIVSADRDYYDHVQSASGPDAESIVFPAYCAERQFTLAGPEMRIGRYSASRGLVPEIDLTGPPTDPGISRLHAVLIERPSGWAVLDPGSANGTMLNGTEIPVNKEVPLHEGDRINLGAWTAITVRHG